MTGEVTRPHLEHEERDGVTRVWLVVPPGARAAEVHGFDADGGEHYGDLVAALLSDHGRPAAPDVWLYTPAALDIAMRLQPGRLVYDVMDDLAAFKDAPEGLRLRQRRTLAKADVVFTGGRSLHRSVAASGRADAHLFPSGVETAHYAQCRRLRRAGPPNVAGYVGVVDERLDLSLLADLADRLPDWTIRVVGPVTKIDPATLPQAPNIEYLGMTPYQHLPEVMAGLHVALMPFALNEATRSISPTKTLEYLAAGLPVISTRVPDVVADYRGVVDLADDGAGFAAACERAMERLADGRDHRIPLVKAEHEWDDIAEQMARVLDRSTSTGPTDRPASA
jgi:glycosyltransferase involved in cell wall biosynthesis